MMYSRQHNATNGNSKAEPVTGASAGRYSHPWVQEKLPVGQRGYPSGLPRRRAFSGLAVSPAPGKMAPRIIGQSTLLIRIMELSLQHFYRGTAVIRGGFEL
jgi:hypothetical protein